jgi:50S ribosomal protein L16 3-hydroxylase
MPQALPQLGGRSAAAFLTDFWQKRPLLIRNAFPGFASPLSPEELAGLAMEDDVESRLVKGTYEAMDWQLAHGPFTEEVFTSLPKNDWTLLVQGVDHHIPEVAELLESFRFVPNWRLDDVMVSYAAPGGSVGPHTDSYDVFLLQGYGERRWEIAEIGPVCLIDGLGLQIIEDFSPADGWVLEPGDMLYLPPNVPHFGVAQTACMTYSVGFKAPADQELLAHYFEQVLTHSDPTARYADPELFPPTSPGRITPEVFNKIRETLRDSLGDDAAIDQWFGRFITQPKEEMEADPDDANVDADLVLNHLGNGDELLRSGWTRWAYATIDGGGELYVNGEAHRHPSISLLALLCNGGPLDRGSLSTHLERPSSAELLATLVRAGALYLP